MNLRFLLFAILILAFATSPLQAGPTFAFQAANPSGFGGSYNNTNYMGVNNFYGTIETNSNGLVGVGTPLHNGMTDSDALYVGFNVNPILSSNYFGLGINPQNPSSTFLGQVVSSAVGTTGGVFTVDGYLSLAAAAFFGVSSTTEMTGVAMITFGTIQTGQNGQNNTIASLQFSFSPGGTAPEPSSLVLMGTGIVGLMAYGLRQTRRSQGACRSLEK